MLRFLFSFLLFAVTPPGATSPTELRRADLMSALHRGGYTVVLRHARTDHSSKETQGSVPKERSEQRNLTEQGINDAKLMRVVFNKYGIKFAEIISSPMFRAVETAQYAAGQPTAITMDLRVYPSTPAQAAIVAAAPKPGTNRLIVTHHFVLESQIPGINPGDIGESEAAVIRRTEEGKVELVGRITLGDWETLAGVASSSNGGANSGVSEYSTAQPQSASNGSAGVPDTDAGRLALAYIAAFNSGDTARMHSFIETYLRVDPARPMEARLKSYSAFYERFAPLVLTTGHTSDSDGLSLAAKSKQGDLRVVVKMSPEQPGRLQSVTFMGTDGGGHR